MSNPKAKEAEANMEEGSGRKELKGELKMPSLPKSLNLEEKKYLLAVERGDLASVKKIIQKTHRHHHVDLNCMDPLGRGALLISIEGENLQMVELLVVMGVDTRDALLHAIDKEFVEAVELLLEHEELIHKEGEPYSWEKLDRTLASFTSDITPLILAAHRNNYEILKILLDRGATLPMPHDVRCGCPDCIRGVQDDSLRHSMSRINAYRALASPSLIALSSTDPILTAFELSLELKSLAYTENEFRQEYIELRRQCQEFAVELLSHTRSSQELAILLNHDPNSPPYEEGEHMKLARLELAIDYKQKKFVAHPSVQQLLGQIWYEGLPGFKRKTLAQKCMDIARAAILFPFYCCLYMFAPNTQTGNLMRKPFMKFLMHASSYLFFLLLLILVSQRFEVLVIQFFGTESMQKALTDQLLRQRGNGPTFLEGVVALYVLGYIFEDGKEMWKEGIQNYFRNMWNFIDMSRNFAYSMVVILRLIAYIQQQAEITKNPSTAYIPREEWDAFDPQLIAEGIFAMANIFSALKLVHLFSINPYLGPLQISLGRMVIDIVKFFFIYSLVLFAFACGLNQLLWYFSDLERQKCFTLPGGLPDWNKNPDACLKWRRFANLFESSQSLFWASFGLMDLTTFELTGIKTYTRFWGLLMFGSYSVINVVVLLNLLIAMMSNSYAIITEHSDTEWKFARSKLWLSYFEEGGTLPPPFNLFPTPKDFMKWCGIREKDKIRRVSSKRRQSHVQERDYRYAAVMRALVWRYIIAMHRKDEMSEVTEDDVNEVKGDISTLRFELLEVFKMNGMDISCAAKNAKTTLGRRMRVWERRLLRDFHVVSVAGEGDNEPISPSGDGDDNNPADKFRKLAMMVVKSNASSSTSASGGSGKCIRTMSQIGRSLSSDSFKSTQNLRKAMDEANRMKVMEPTPGSSPRDSPMPLLQDSGSSALELLHNIVEEEREEQDDDGNSLFDFENNTISKPIAQWKLPNPDSKKDQGKEKAIGKLQKSAAPPPVAPTQLTATNKDSNPGAKTKAPIPPPIKSSSEPTPDSGKTGGEPADLMNTAETEKKTSLSSTQKTADAKVPCPTKQVSESGLAANSAKDSFPSASLNPKHVSLTGQAARSGENVACNELSKSVQGETSSAQKAAAVATPPNSSQDTTSTSVTVTNETSHSRNGTKRRGSVPMVTMDKNDITVPPVESITVVTDNLPKDSKIAIDDHPILPHQKSKPAPLKPFTSFPAQETSTSASNPGTPSCTSASNPGTPSCFSKNLESSEKTVTTPAPELLLQVGQQPALGGQPQATPGNEQDQASAAPATKRVTDVKTIKRENKGWI